MAVSTRRPVIGAGQSAPFAYANGEFYWSLDGDRNELAAYTDGYAITGEVWNQSTNEVPIWQWNILPSNDPAAMQEVQQKLEAYFPQPRNVSKTANFEEAFIYFPQLDEAFVGQNHPDIIQHFYDYYDQMQNEFPEHYTMPRKDFSRMGVYGWIISEGPRRYADIFSDFYEGFNLTHPEEVQKALNAVNEKLPATKQVHDFTTGPPPDVREEMERYFGAVYDPDEDDPDSEEFKEDLRDRLFEEQERHKDKAYLYDIGAAKFNIGDPVIIQGYGNAGNILAAHARRDGWWYLVREYDDQGYLQDAEWPEKDLIRWGQKWEVAEPEDTLQTMFDIPPSGEDYYRTAAEYQLPEDEQFGMGLQRGRTYGMVWKEDLPLQLVTFKGMYMVSGEPHYAQFWINNNYQKPIKIVYDHFVWMMENHMIFPLDRGDTLNYLPWSEEEQDYYRTSANQVWYHVTPRHYRESILEHGIDPNHSDTWKGADYPYVWAWDSDRYERALGWAESGSMKGARPMDIWHINPEGLDWVPDPHASDPEDTMYKGAWATQRIPPDNLIRYEEYEGGGTPWWKWTKVKKSDMLDTDMQATDSLTHQLNEDLSARTAFGRLQAAGGQVYVVGGAVRDALMGKSPKDIDMMVAGLDESQIVAALRDAGAINLTGKDFGVYRFKARGASDEVEIALPRTERSTGTGHKDFEVTADPNLDPTVDLSRRDFTINAMAWHPESGEFLDPHKGQQDLQDKRLALVSDSAFEDDPLRIVRALVATARFGFTPDPKLIESMNEHAAQIRHLPGERVQMELDKLLSAPDPAQAMELAEQTGVLDYMAPELTSTVGFDQQNPHHNLDVWKHTMQVLRKASQLSNDPDLRLAALFHDSGKPDSFWLDPSAPEGGGGHFYKGVLNGEEVGANHEEVGADLVRQFMERLRYPKKRIERVETIVRNHMFPYFTTKRGARKFLRSLDNDSKLAFDLLTLRESDASGKTNGSMNEFDANSLAKSRELLTQVLDEGENIGKGDLAVTGHDLIQLGMKPGPEFRQILDRLHDAVIEDPSVNNREDLLKLVQAD
jgi:tRNA nucleotidyltransferase (CCA-adding enzyme)